MITEDKFPEIFNEEAIWRQINRLRQYHREELDKQLVSVRHYLQHNEEAQKLYACQAPEIVNEIKKRESKIKNFSKYLQFFT